LKGSFQIWKKISNFERKLTNLIKNFIIFLQNLTPLFNIWEFFQIGLFFSKFKKNFNFYKNNIWQNISLKKIIFIILNFLNDLFVWNLTIFLQILQFPHKFQYLNKNLTIFSNLWQFSLKFDNCFQIKKLSNFWKNCQIFRKIVLFLKKLWNFKKNCLLVFGRLGAHFLTNLNLKRKTTFNRPSADLGLISKKINKKHKIPFYRPSADLGLIFHKIK
jgi:hypothetical protein